MTATEAQIVSGAVDSVVFHVMHLSDAFRSRSPVAVPGLVVPLRGMHETDVFAAVVPSAALEHVRYVHHVQVVPGGRA